MQAKRRTFTAGFKARILADGDADSQPGEVGVLLRREGLYTSHLTSRRQQRKAGALRELARGLWHGRRASVVRSLRPLLTESIRAQLKGTRKVISGPGPRRLCASLRWGHSGISPGSRQTNSTRLPSGSRKNSDRQPTQSKTTGRTSRPAVSSLSRSAAQSAISTVKAK